MLDSKKCCAFFLVKALRCASHIAGLLRYARIPKIGGADFILYIIGSIVSAGCPFSSRNASRVSGSSATVSSPIMSVKLSIP